VNKRITVERKNRLRCATLALRIVRLLALKMISADFRAHFLSEEIQIFGRPGFSLSRVQFAAMSDLLMANERHARPMQVGRIYPRVMKDGELDAGAWSRGMVAGLIHDIPRIGERSNESCTRPKKSLRSGFTGCSRTLEQDRVRSQPVSQLRDVKFQLTPRQFFADMFRTRITLYFACEHLNAAFQRRCL
jgi:hypothetical protein